MNVNKELKLMFLHVPKAAGKSIMEAFDLKKARGMINRSIVDAVTTAQYFTHIELATYTKFAVVRNPWDRVVSLYHFRKKNNDLYNGYHGANVFGGDKTTPEGKELSFKEWVLDPRTRGTGHYWKWDLWTHRPINLETQMPTTYADTNATYVPGQPNTKEMQEAIYKDHHLYYIMYMEWFPQIDFLTLWNNKPFVNEIIKLENLDEDLDKLCTEYKLPKVTLPRKNSVARSKKNYVDYYDEELKNFVENLFIKDIKTFGYKFGE